MTVHTKKAVSSGGNIYDKLDIDSGLRPPLAVNKPWDENVSDGSERLEPRVFIKGGATFTLWENGDYTYNGEPDNIPIQLDGGQVLSLPVNMEGSDPETEDIIQDDGDFVSDRNRALKGEGYKNEKEVLQEVCALEKGIRTEYDNLQGGEGKRLSRITVITELLGGVSDEDLDHAYKEVEEGVQKAVSRGLEEQIRGLDVELEALKTQESSLRDDLTVKNEEKTAAMKQLQTAQEELADKETAVVDARQALGFHYTPPVHFNEELLSSIAGKKVIANLRPKPKLSRMVSSFSNLASSILPKDAEKARNELIGVLKGLVGDNDLMLAKARVEQERLSSMGIDEVVDRIGLLRDLSDAGSTLYKTKEILKAAIESAKSVKDLMQNLMPKNTKVFPRGVPDGKNFETLLLAALFDGGAEEDHTFRNFSDFIVKVSNLDSASATQFNGVDYNDSRDELNEIVLLVHFLGLPNKVALRRFLNESTNPDSNLREAINLMQEKFNIDCGECSDFNALIEKVRSCNIVKLREDTGSGLAKVISRLEANNAYVKTYLKSILSVKGKPSRTLTTKKNIIDDTPIYERIRAAFPDDQEIQGWVDKVIGPRTDDFMDTFWEEFETVDEVTPEQIAEISKRDFPLATKLTFLKGNRAEDIVQSIIRGPISGEDQAEFLRIFEEMQLEGLLSDEGHESLRQLLRGSLEVGNRNPLIMLLGEMKDVGVLEDEQYEQLKALVNLHTGQPPGKKLPDAVKTALPDPVKTAYEAFESFKGVSDTRSDKPDYITQDSWKALQKAIGEQNTAISKVKVFAREFEGLETALAEKTAKIDALNRVIVEKTRQRSAVEDSQIALDKGWSAIFQGYFARGSDLDSVVDAIIGDYGANVTQALFTKPLQRLKVDSLTAVQSFKFLKSPSKGQGRRDALGLKDGVKNEAEKAKLNAELTGLRRLQVLQKKLAERAAKKPFTRGVR